MIELPDFLGALSNPLKAYSHLGFKSITELLPAPSYDLESRILELVVVGCPSYDTREGLWDTGSVLDDPAAPAFAVRWEGYAAYGVAIRSCSTPSARAKSDGRVIFPQLDGAFRRFNVPCAFHDIDVVAPQAPAIVRLR